MERLIYTSRYFRVITTGLIFLINITTSSAGFADTTIGVENKYIIPNSSFTATSQFSNDYHPYHARLNGNLYGWAPSRSKLDDPNQYLQIDLGLPYVICSVATQGSSGGYEWVTQYKISLSMDNRNWTLYQENGALKLFAGNTDSSTIKKNTLTQPLARYIRFIPTHYNTWKTMRVGIYGYVEGCTDTTIGVENKYIIPDSSFTATSQFSNDYHPYHARLNGNLYGWTPSRSKLDDPNQYLQIDLGLPYVICSVATQGSSAGGEWVTQYNISLSMDNITWTLYQENGALKMFAGNIDSNTIEKHTLTQSLARYIRFIPTHYNTWKTMRVGIYGYVEACENFPLGMESGAIQDGNITASSAQHPAKNARLHYTSDSSWCASTSDSNSYLQIDLGSSHLICALAIQGNNMADQWVKTYQINTSTDGITWTTYQENNADRIFYGNYDRTTVVRRILYHGIVTRYLRIVPKTSKTGTPCLRTEIYGYPFDTACSRHSVGIPSSIFVPGHRFTATSVNSYFYVAHKWRLGAASAWATKSNTNSGDYLQVDLGAVFYICAVATQGSGYSANEWITKYKISYSTNNNQWNTYRENGTDKEFTGNTDKTSVVSNLITNRFKAKFVRVQPTTYNGHKSMRIEFKGIASGCVSSLGLENYNIKNSQMTSSSSSDNSHAAPRARLYDSSSWCSSTTSNTEYIQVNLGQVKTVTGIATQGDKTVDKWTITYKVSYSFDSTTWNEYKEGQVVKNLEGNTNRNGVKVNWLRHPIAARYVRIIPQTHNSGGRHCLRFDLYGCDVFAVPKVIMNTADLILPSIKGRSSTLTCSVLGEPTPDIQWFNNGTKINGATQSTLQVQFIFAEDVVSKYNCTRQDPNTRAVVCNTFYTCRATYPSYVPSGGMDEASVKVTVNLNAPEAPKVTAALPNKRSITLSWTAMTTSGDVGNFTSYTIQLHNQSGSIVTHNAHHPTFNYIVKHLKPYTNYSIRMNAISAAGQGLWSSWLNVTTLLAEPEGAPSITGTNVLSSQGIELHFKYSQLDLLHGPMAGFRIFYRPQGGSQLHIDVGNVDMVTLTNLIKYSEYSISVAVRNTLYVGPASSGTTLRTLEDVPDIRPQNTTATKINDTTFLVTWQPLTTTQSNGVVTKYEIFWSLVVGRRSRRSLQEMLNATTQATHFTLYNLKVCANYTVSVRGYTSVGPGPKSTISILTSRAQPGKPTGVQAEGQKRTSIEVRWEKPSVPPSLLVFEYTINVKGSKAYWPQYSFSKTYTQNGAQTNMVIDGLVPGTRYEFWVTASTTCGKSEKSASSRRDTDIDKPVKPEGNSMTLKDKFNVSLWSVDPINGPISSYQVIVIKGNKDASNLPTNISDYKDGKEFYVTAELKPNELKSSFAVGDNKKYGKYKNVQLDKGKTYTIAERAITEHQGKFYAGQAASVATIEVTQDPTEYSNSTIWALEGDKVTIGCHTSGHEPITYFWTKTGSLLVVDSPVVKIRGNTLIISLNSDKEFGTYVCTATNSEKTVIYRINRVELKKYKCAIVPYVIPLALIILGLIICIVYLVYRLRRKERQHNHEKKMKRKKDETGITNDVMDNSNYQDDVIKNLRKPETPNADEIETPGYMELQPRQSSVTIYQSIQEPENRPGKNAASHTQGMTGHEQYMDLKPRVNTEYETLHHKKYAPAQDYEDVGQGFSKNISPDDTEA